MFEKRTTRIGGQNAKFYKRIKNYTLLRSGCNIIILLFFTKLSFSQEKVFIPNHKFLNGYFILLRDTIPNLDNDFDIGNYSFKEFFVPDSIELLNIRNVDSLIIKNRIIVLSNCISGYVYKSDIEIKYIDSLLKTRHSKREEEEYFPFSLSNIQSDLIESRLKLIFVYKGKLEVWGPIDTTLPYLNGIETKGFIYLKNPSNYLEFLFCAVLQGKSSCGITIHCDD